MNPEKNQLVQKRTSTGNQMPNQSSQPTHSHHNIGHSSLNSSNTTVGTNAAFREMLETIETPHFPTPRPIISRLATILHSRQQSESSIQQRRSETSHHLTRVSATKNKSTRFQNLVRRVRKSLGAEEIMKELRSRREEYIISVEEMLTKKKLNQYAEDHPYVALRRRIEAMSRTGKEEYNIKYEPFSNVPRISETTVPIYATDYDNERKKQARRRQFRFGLDKNEHYDPDKIDTYIYDPTDKPDKMHWSSDTEIHISTLALVFTASNLFRFPHACYVNGGIVFFLVYCFLVVTLIQPLTFFEMLIGQFSWKGEWGFAQLHRYTKGFPYALAFVTLTFVTLNNAVLGYTALYSLGPMYSNPGNCGFEKDYRGNNCIPYNEVEKFSTLLQQKKTWIEKNLHSERVDYYNATLYLSTELFFRFQILNWKGKLTKDFLHWKYVVAFVIVLIIIIPASVQSYLVSTMSRIWIYFACVLPVLLSIVLFHQYAFRNGYNTPRYFSYFIWDRVKTFTFWSDALQMAFTTVGVGYGLLIRISSRNDFRFVNIYRNSWILSIFVMVFCLLCSMVVYTELAILGLIAKADEFTHILSEGFGVSFVCLSGALLKFGPTWIFTTVFAWMTIFNIWPQIIATHMSVSCISSSITIKNAIISKAIAFIITAVYEVALISLYTAHAGFAPTDSFDLFGGSGAACLILLAELGIAFILFGFREFMTDIEIMLDSPVSFAFQIQMIYVIPPILMISIIVIGITWFESPPVLIENRTTGSRTFQLGILLNSMPIIIMIIFAYMVYRNRNKVAPALENNTIILDKSKGVETFWKHQSRWLDRRGAVAANLKSERSLFRRSKHRKTLQVWDVYGDKEAYFAHADLKENLRNLFARTNAKALWNDLTNKIIASKRFKSLAQATRFILRQKETRTTSMEAIFLKNIIHQCSVLDLSICSDKDLLGRSLDNKEILLLDNLLKIASYSTDESDDDSNDDVDDDRKTLLPSWVSKMSFWGDDTGNSSSITDGSSVYRRVVGKPDQSPEEVRLDLSVRIKKALDFPYEKELSRLKVLKKHRLLKESQVISRYDSLPEEHFITLKITKRKEPSFLIGVRVVVVPSRDHFVLKRLPIPRPFIFQTTNEHIESLRGVDRNHKIFEFVMSEMKTPLWKVDLTRLLQPSSRVPLLDNLDADVYTFLDPIKTCIVVLESEQESDWFNYKWRWLTKPVRRKHKLDEIPALRESTFLTEGVSIIGLTKREEENRRIQKMINEPPDIVYHPPGEDTWTPDESLTFCATRSSSSSSSASEKHLVLGDVHKKPKTEVKLVNEITFQQNRAAFQKTFKHPQLDSKLKRKDPLGDFPVKHLTNEDWKRRKANHYKPVVVIHEKSNPFKQSTQAVSNLPVIKIQGQKSDQLEIKNSIMNDRLSLLPIWSQAEDQLKVTFTDGLLNQQQSTRFIRDYSNLKNDYPNYVYYINGRTLIIEKKANEMFLMASSEDSIASKAMLIHKSTALVPFRTNARTSLPKKASILKTKSVVSNLAKDPLRHNKSSI